MARRAVGLYSARSSGALCLCAFIVLFFQSVPPAIASRSLREELSSAGASSSAANASLQAATAATAADATEKMLADTQPTGSPGSRDAGIVEVNVVFGPIWKQYSNSQDVIKKDLAKELCQVDDKAVVQQPVSPLYETSTDPTTVKYTCRTSNLAATLQACRARKNQDAFVAAVKRDASPLARLASSTLSLVDNPNLITCVAAR